MKRSMLMALAFVFLCVCGASPRSSAAVRVVVSIEPQLYFIKQLGGELVTATSLLPSGSFHGVYEPSAAQMKELSEAQMFVRSRVEYEDAWWSKIQAANQEMLVVDATAGIEFLKGHHHHDEQDAEEDETKEAGDDPHVWLSPRLAKIQIENIYEGLITVDPENEAAYASNKHGLLKAVDELDRKIRAQLAELETRTFMVFHPAWSYFAAEYDLKQIAIEGEGKEPSAAELAEFIKIAQEEQVKVIFVQPQTSSRTANIIAKQIGAKVELLDPMSADWMKNLRRVAEKLAKALRKKEKE